MEGTRRAFPAGREPFMLTARKFFEPGWGDSTSRSAPLFGGSPVFDRAAAYSERRLSFGTRNK